MRTVIIILIIRQNHNDNDRGDNTHNDNDFNDDEFMKSGHTNSDLWHHFGTEPCNHEASHLQNGQSQSRCGFGIIMIILMAMIVMILVIMTWMT